MRIIFRNSNEAQQLRNIIELIPAIHASGDKNILWFNNSCFEFVVSIISSKRAIIGEATCYFVAWLHCEGSKVVGYHQTSREGLTQSRAM